MDRYAESELNFFYWIAIEIKMEVYLNQADPSISIVDNEKDKYLVNQNAINHFRIIS